MAVQVANLLEALAAYSTGVGTFVHMRGRDVRLQIRFSYEGGFADIALERPYVSVDR